ncbi:MAG: polyprenyl synthetase family protein [Planctomycetia bacterium]|nr:polyprenyl synthetase family protein [Planctomycetia bacterium]
MVQASATNWFAQHAAEMRPKIDAALAEFTSFAGPLSGPADALGWRCPPRLREAMRYMLLAPGKRLRPLVVLLSANACGKAAEVALHAACAVEMVHTYSLIHDDLPCMDDDDLRRGQPTCHRKFDEATAVLAGDALLALAFEALAAGPRTGQSLPRDAAAACCAVLAKAAGATALVGGQSDDLAAEESDGGLDQLLAIHARKTAAMFVASARLGGICAGASAVQLEALTQYGHSLGLAFQIMDDLLDVRGQESNVGKRLGKDSRRGKLTYPGLIGVDESLRKAEEHIERARGAVSALGSDAAGLDALALYVVERDR